jgi:uncharacterized membrane protein
MIQLAFSEINVALVICGAALVTYALRLGGLLLAEKLPRTIVFRAFMETLPGTILLSLVAPAVVEAGPLGGFAALATALCALKTRNLLVSMLAGMGIVALGRLFLTLQ